MVVAVVGSSRNVLFQQVVVDPDRDSARVTGRTYRQQGGRRRRTGCPNARNAGAADGIRLDCDAFVCVAATELVGEIALLALACDDEDGAPGETGAIGELNALEAPFVVHEAPDVLRLDGHSGGVEPLTLSGIGFLAVCQQHDIAAPPAEQQRTLDSPLEHAPQAELRERLSPDLPTVAVRARDDILPP